MTLAAEPGVLCVTRCPQPPDGSSCEWVRGSTAASKVELKPSPWIPASLKAATNHVLSGESLHILNRIDALIKK